MHHNQCRLVFFMIGLGNSKGSILLYMDCLTVLLVDYSALSFKGVHTIYWKEKQ